MPYNGSMKRIFFSITLTALLIYFLIFPKQMAADTAAGLLLWYKSVLPTLLPFCIISYIIIQSSLYHTVFQWLASHSPGRKKLRPETLYPLILGFVCGFPIGAKLSGDMYALGRLDAKEAAKICAVSNQFGPAFITNYIALSQLGSQRCAIILLAAVFLPPLLLGMVWLKSGETDCSVHKKTASRSQINFKIIDAGIINGFETMLRVAGYIVIFSILSGAVLNLSLNRPVTSSLLTGILEVTTGARNIAQIPEHLLSLTGKVMLIAPLLSFGGCCGLFQTSAIMKDCHFRIRQYIGFKLLCALTSIGLSKLFCLLLL